MKMYKLLINEVMEVVNNKDVSNANKVVNELNYYEVNKVIETLEEISNATTMLPLYKHFNNGQILVMNELTSQRYDINNIITDNHTEKLVQLIVITINKAIENCDLNSLHDYMHN